MPNPFRFYPLKQADLAVSYGIIRDVCRSTGYGKAVVWRTLRGVTFRPKTDLVEALNAWLVANGFPAADGSGKTARMAANEIRNKQ